MRAVVQRVRQASVRCLDGVDAGRDASIGVGLVVLVGVTHDDDVARARRLAEKLWGLRIFDDAEGVANLACADVDGEVLVVSQFTLYADTRRGRRPSYLDAARPEDAEPLVTAVADHFTSLGARVATGCFGAAMELALVNDGPWTMTVEV